MGKKPPKPEQPVAATAFLRLMLLSLERHSVQLVKISVTVKVNA